MAKKCVLILLDGLGDRSYKQFGGKTPLQAARTPALDRLAHIGASGLYHAAAVGQALPSENAHFVMFGYDMADFPGRGALEALGAGIALERGAVAVLAHFANLRETDGCFVLGDGKPKISQEDASALFHAVDKYETNGVSIHLIQTQEYRGMLTLHGNVAPFVTDTDPFREGRPVIRPRPWADHAHDAAAQNTANALEAYLLWACQRLKAHAVNSSRMKKGLRPINGLVTQRAGQLKLVSPFLEKFGFHGLSLSSGSVYWGLCKYLGIDYEEVRDTGDPGKDIAERLAMAHDALNEYDFIHVHTKTPDEAAHTKDPKAKKKVIASLDQGIGQAIQPLLDDPDVFVIITADHSTPSAGPLIHSGETVPLLFCGQGVRRDAVSQFDEVSAAAGALGCVRGKELMYLILNHLDRSKLHGLMDTPEDQPFWPGNYEALQTPRGAKMKF